MKPTLLFLSCEHAVNTVPPRHLSLFKDKPALLETHRAIDFGALDITLSLSQACQCDYVTASISRLLIDCNRSLTSADCFSEFTSHLPAPEKQHLIDNYYLPYRTRCESMIRNAIESGHQVFHLSVHSFTPIFNGVTRNACIGLLYDPKRHGEKEVARQWQKLLSEESRTHRVRMNYPYRGASDGFTSALRKEYSEKDYIGMEVEVNQSLVKDKTSLNTMITLLSKSLKELLLLL